MKAKIILTTLLTLAFVASIGTGVYYYREYNKVKAELAKASVADPEEIKAIVKKISAFMDLPTDEEPTLATVLEKDKLQDQPFFKTAENGDKILIYSKAMKAIPYRPSTNKIIEVGPIQISQQEEGKTEDSNPITENTLSPEPTTTPTE